MDVLTETTFSKGTIYPPLNNDMKAINDMFDYVPWKERVYILADSVLEDNYKDVLPSKFLNSLTPSGMPNQEIKQKKGVPIMLLRNLQAGPYQTLQNTTRIEAVQKMDKGVE